MLLDFTSAPSLLYLQLTSPLGDFGVSSADLVHARLKTCGSSSLDKKWYIVIVMLKAYVRK